MTSSQYFESQQDADDWMQSLPYVTDEMLEAIIERTAGHVVTPQERANQMVSFVWGNDLEGGSTWTKVREHINLPLD